MTSIQTQHALEASATTPTLATWLTSTDHKVVGRLYIGTGLFSLLGGLVLAVLVAFERINADSYQIFSDATSVQILAVARNLLTFGGVVPLLFGLMLAIVPLQLGSRGIAFPRLATGSFWMWLTGLAMMVASIIGNGGPGGGNAELVDLYLAAFMVMLLGLAMAATSLVVTILTSRTPGMGILRAPLLTWSALVTSVGVLLTVPVLIGTTVYVYVDHRYARLGFGGNKGVNTWIGWALSQPFTYLLAIPALGMVLDAVPVLTRNRLARRPAAFVAVALVGIAAINAVTQTRVTLAWDGDSFLSGLGTKIADLLPFALLNGLPVLGLLGVLGLSLLTLKGGRPMIAAPLAFSLVGLLGIVLGATSHILGGIEDAGLQGTIYETGSYVGITFGSVIVAFGAVCFWGPKLWGRRISDTAALPLVPLALGAIGLGSLPYMIAGFADQPAGLLNNFAYRGPQGLWNVLTAVGFAMMLILAATFTALAMKSFTSGTAAGDDPWNGTTLEWATSSPPPADNFVDIMVVNSATPLADLKSSSNGKDA